MKQSLLNPCNFGEMARRSNNYNDTLNKKNSSIRRKIIALTTKLKVYMIMG
jgi:hypothetical protein